MFEEAVIEGFEAGRRFAEQWRLEVGPREIAPTVDELRLVVDQWPFELNDAFVYLVSSVLGTASVTRIANGYPELTRDQIVSYVAHSADVLDSLKHI